MALSPEAKRFARSILQDLETDSQDLVGYIQYRPLKELPDIQYRIMNNVEDLETTKLFRRFMSFKGNRLVYGRDAFVLPSQFYPDDDDAHETLCVMNLATLATWILHLVDEVDINFAELVSAIPYAFINMAITSRYHWSERYKLDAITMLFAKKCDKKNLSVKEAEIILHDMFSVIEPTMESQNRILLITELMRRDGLASVPRLFTMNRFLIRMAEFIRACCFLKGFPLAPDEREEVEPNGNIQPQNLDQNGGIEGFVNGHQVLSSTPIVKPASTQFLEAQSLSNHEKRSGSPMSDRERTPGSISVLSQSIMNHSETGNDGLSGSKMLAGSSDHKHDSSRNASFIELKPSMSKTPHSSESPNSSFKLLKALYPDQLLKRKDRTNIETTNKKIRKATNFQVKSFDQQREKVLAQLAGATKK